MLTTDFINNLSFLLREMPEEERRKVLDYYSELIADKVEGGQNEEDIINSFGDINMLAQNILSDSNFIEQRYYNSYNQQKRKGIHPALLAVIIVFAPVWFGLGIGLLAMIFSLCVAAFAVIISFFAAAIGLCIGGVAAIVGSGIALVQVPSLSLLGFGAGLVAIGMGVLLGIGMFFATKGFFKLVNIIIISIKNLFSKRRAS